VLSLLPQPWEDELYDRLTAGLVGEDVVLELFDRVAPWVWGYALHRSGNEGDARRVTIKAFLTAVEHPDIFSDRRVPICVRMLMLIHLDTQPVVTGHLPLPGRTRQAVRRCAGRLLRVWDRTRA
jgi:hypothetical protein